ncbi:hypothetical protein KOR34_42700 [Posidoniimonas corsicana]|uniref:Leucine Rich repeats (2 copies) n=1 Tax=Posidoniimonas corsicana TaxID=1938618 RepID=A0A5C5V428_9BACT|nr:hypothetical protein [Posidoniimonas corsicana]TWT32507.1 hypothetical protein KOR34_42700 [Posidoniimonas corsicana]
MHRQATALSIGLATFLATVLSASGQPPQDDQDGTLYLHAYLRGGQEVPASNGEEVARLLQAATDEHVEGCAEWMLGLSILNASSYLSPPPMGEIKGDGWQIRNGVVTLASDQPATDADLSRLAAFLPASMPLNLRLPVGSQVTDDGFAELASRPMTSLSANGSLLGDATIERIAATQKRLVEGPLRLPHDLQQALQPGQRVDFYLTSTRTRPQLRPGESRRPLLVKPLECGGDCVDIAQRFDLEARVAELRKQSFFGVPRPTQIPHLLSHTWVSESGSPTALLLGLEFNGLGHLEMSATRITDDGLAHAAQIKGLGSLGVAATDVTDRGVASLAAAESLSSLYLNGADVTDAAVDALMRCEKLRVLDLRGTQLTSATALQLAKNERLTTLGLSGPNLSLEQTCDVFQAMPALQTVGLDRYPNRQEDRELLANRLPRFFTHQPEYTKDLHIRLSVETFASGELDGHSSVAAIGLSGDESRLTVLCLRNDGGGIRRSLHTVDLAAKEFREVELPGLDFDRDGWSVRASLARDGSHFAVCLPPESTTTSPGEPAGMGEKWRVAVWRMPTGVQTEAALVAERYFFHQPHALALSSSGKALAVCKGKSDNARLGVLQVVEGLPTARAWPDPLPMLKSYEPLVLSPDGRLVVGMEHSGVQLYDLEQQTRTTVCPADGTRPSGPAAFTHQANVKALKGACFSANSDKLIVSAEMSYPGYNPNQAIVFDIKAGRVTASFAEAYNFVASADAQWLVTADANNSVLWGLGGDQPDERYFAHNGLSSHHPSALSSDGARLFSVMGAAGRLHARVTALPDPAAK